MKSSWNLHEILLKLQAVDNVTWLFSRTCFQGFLLLQLKPKLWSSFYCFTNIIKLLRLSLPACTLQFHCTSSTNLQAICWSNLLINSSASLVSLSPPRFDYTSLFPSTSAHLSLLHQLTLLFLVRWERKGGSLASIHSPMIVNRW